MDTEQRPSVAKKLLTERRSSIRFPSNLQASCQLLDDETVWPATVHDISTKGLSLKVGCMFPPDKVLRIRFQSGSKYYIAEAIVIHVRPERTNVWSHGCRFSTEIDGKELVALLG